MLKKNCRIFVFDEDGTGAFLEVSAVPDFRFTINGTVYSDQGTVQVEWPAFQFDRDKWWSGVDMRATGAGVAPGSVVYKFSDSSHGGDWIIEALSTDNDTRHRIVLTDPNGKKVWIMTEDNAPPIVWAVIAGLYCLGSAVILSLITDCIEECGGQPAAVKVEVRFMSEFPYLPICGKVCICKTGDAATSTENGVLTSSAIALPAVENVSPKTTIASRCIVSVSLLRVSYSGGDEGVDWRIRTVVQGREFRFRQRTIAHNSTSNFGEEVFRGELGHCDQSIDLDVVCTGIEVDTPDPNETGSTPTRITIECPGQKLVPVIVNVDSAVLTFMLNVQATCGIATVKTSTTTTSSGGETSTTTTTTTSETPITTNEIEHEEVGISAAHHRRRLLSNRELRRAGVDAHAEKDAVEARPNSRFDLYIDTNNEVWVVRKTAAPWGGEAIGTRRGLTYQ